ncbi:MFS transporter [Catenuloplanes japonicus]|uniref:MFS transporter n=1 Tax=Catenuloplanes japonicus TaxID=33876 RepID=UPI000524DB9A|nr:MFS transporter [Catenuloplanes japonicus]
MGRRGGRVGAVVLALMVLALGTVSWPFTSPAQAAPISSVAAPGDLCSTEEWQTDFRACVDKLADVSQQRAQCLKAPKPGSPDAGLAGWFAGRPTSATEPGPQGIYSEYGYAGYSYTTYDIDGGCMSTLIAPEFRFETTVANGEFMVATAIIGASNALRERAWDPGTMWGWADPLVQDATRAVYEKVFTVFGIVTLAVIGLYLLWRSRQADMSNLTTTVGWAVLVMVVITALAAWPVKSANIADSTLIATLGVVHDAVGPRAEDRAPEDCRLGTPEACKDHRPPAVRASDTVTESMLYKNWIRGVLGSSETDTAKKYGMALYDARSLSWEEIERHRSNPNDRDATIAAKNRQWMKVAEQIKGEDAEAYEYLQGTKGMERIGAGFIAMLAAVLFALFDITAAVLVLLGFLIFRWAVIAAPILGTVGLLRPAGEGLRRLANAVVAAVFNIAIFGTGAAIYLFAVDLIMSTATLPGWLQVVLVFLCGVVGWMLLRPYRRITQMGGRSNSEADSWSRRVFRDLREASRIGTDEDDRGSRRIKQRDVTVEQINVRPEARLEDPVHASPRVETTSAPQVRTRSDGTEHVPEAEPVVAGDGGGGSAPRRTRRPAQWTEPDVADAPASYAIYRPETGKTTTAPQTPRVRAEAR